MAKRLLGNSSIPLPMEQERESMGYCFYDKHIKKGKGEKRVLVEECPILKARKGKREREKGKRKLGIFTTFLRTPPFLCTK